jgi:cytochrome c oxidase subunit II
MNVIAATAAPATPSIFAPVSTPAFAIRDLSFLVLAIVTCIFIVVAGVTVYAIIRCRYRPGDDGRDPPQVYGSTQIELAWTVVPFLIVIVLFLTTTRYIFAIERPAATRDTVEVTVVGNQWWWEIRYPQLGIVTANELHVPVSDTARPTRTFITLESADVIHSFWIPQLAGKTDVIPGKTNRTWIEPRTPGTYVGQCAEFCGVQHAWMLLRVTICFFPGGSHVTLLHSCFLKPRPRARTRDRPASTASRPRAHAAPRRSSGARRRHAGPGDRWRWRCAPRRP